MDASRRFQAAARRSSRVGRRLTDAKALRGSIDLRDFVTPVLLLAQNSDRTATRLRRSLESRGAGAELVRYEDEIFGDAAETVDQLARLGEFLTEHLR
jgi:hypothetical protein